jgi:hypothetical protein
MMTNHDAERELAAAFIEMQAELEQPIKRSVGQARGGKYKYVDLAAVLEGIKPVLAKHGFGVTQPLCYYTDESGKRERLLQTRLMYKNGEFIASQYPLGDHKSPQELGSEITYARRYSLCALLGIVGDEDDDGAAASQKVEPKKVEPKKAAPKPNTKADSSNALPPNLIPPVEGASDDEWKVWAITMRKAVLGARGLREIEELYETHLPAMKGLSKVSEPAYSTLLHDFTTRKSALQNEDSK